ncbi:hypothetical protein F5B21DRAFT_111862 [Xylaria acuta]|nr:hypothetical protein F5B21DRAFT_111862 [Xylaria acuta]
MTTDYNQEVVPSGDEDYPELISTLQSDRPFISALSTNHVDSDKKVEHGSPGAHEQKEGDSLKSNTEQELITTRHLPQSPPPSTSESPSEISSSSPSSPSPMSLPPYSPLQRPVAEAGIQRRTSTSDTFGVRHSMV